MLYEYRTDFRLVASVKDFRAAKQWLIDEQQRDDMTEYLKERFEDEKKPAPPVERIKWVLDDEQSGHIEMLSTEKLSKELLSEISEWVSGQNADGLGESFEQKPFAAYQVNPDTGEEWSDWDWDDDIEPEDVMASFDWETNDYEFTLMTPDLTIDENDLKDLDSEDLQL